MSPEMAQNGPSKFCGEGLMLTAERTWCGRYVRVTRVTPLTFYPEWMVQVAHQGAGAPGSWWPWPRLCQELRTQELAGVLWPTWRRFNTRFSPSATYRGGLLSNSVDQPKFPNKLRPSRWTTVLEIAEETPIYGWRRHFSPKLRTSQF